MKDKKSPAFSIRLPADTLEQIEAIAAAEGMNRTQVITDAVEFYLAQSGIRSPNNEALKELSSLVGLLKEFHVKISSLASKSGDTQSFTTTSPDKVHKRSRDRIRTLEWLHRSMNTNSSKPETQRLPRSNLVQVDPQADELIVRMTAEGATLSDISSSLNESGYVSATGQAWTQNRVRDYRQKLRDRGLIR